MVRQFETAWKLIRLHLDGLATEECLWRPAPEGLYEDQIADGRWRADWPSHEGYDLGPPSIAWLTWHVGFWWSMVLDHSFGDATLSRENIMWLVMRTMCKSGLNTYRESGERSLIKPAATSCDRHGETRWPFQDRPFGDVIAWVNVELTRMPPRSGMRGSSTL